MSKQLYVPERQFDILIGAPRSGKSMFSVEVIKPYRQNVIIVKHTSNINDKTHGFLTEKTTDNWRQGVPPGRFVKCKMAIRNKKQFLEFCAWVADNYRNGLLIVDDGSMLIRDRMPEIMEEIAAMRAHYGIDLLMIFHGFTGCPIDQFRYVNNLFIFNTNDNFEYKKTKIPQYKRVCDAVERAKINFQSTNLKIKHTPQRVNITCM